jgi:hypothetical protein
LKKTLPICFALLLGAAASGCVGDSEDVGSTDSAEDAAHVSQEEGKAAIQEDTEESPANKELVNFPKERIRKLVLVKELTRDHPDGPPFRPTHVQYKSGTLYVFDDNTYTLLQYDDELFQKAADSDIALDSPNENIFSVLVDESNTVIASGSEYVHVVDDEYKRFRNVYGIKSLAAANNKLYAYNFGREAGTAEYAFIVYDYNLRREGAVAANPFVNDLYRLSYVKLVGDDKRICFAVNSSTRVAEFNLMHGYPKSAVAVRTLSIENEFKPYIDKIDEWAAQPPPAGRAPRSRQIVTGMCFLDGRLCIMTQWRKQIYIGEFGENDAVEYIYTIRTNGGSALGIAARNAGGATYFYLPVTRGNEGSVHVYKHESG